MLKRFAKVIKDLEAAGFTLGALHQRVLEPLTRDLRERRGSVEFNVTARMPGMGEDETEQLLDELAGLSAVVSPTGESSEVVLTLEAGTATQAVRMALGLLAGCELEAFEVLPTSEFDWRHGNFDDLMSVSDAAELLGITPQGVRQRIKRGTLASWRVGREHMVRRADLVPGSSAAAGIAHVAGLVEGRAS